MIEYTVEADIQLVIQVYDIYQ